MTASVVTRSKCDNYSGIGHDVRCIKLDSRSEAMADHPSFYLTIGCDCLGSDGGTEWDSTLR